MAKDIYKYQSKSLQSNYAPHTSGPGGSHLKIPPQHIPQIFLWHNEGQTHAQIIENINKTWNIQISQSTLSNLLTKNRKAVQEQVLSKIAESLRNTITRDLENIEKYKDKLTYIMDLKLANTDIKTRELKDLIDTFKGLTQMTLDLSGIKSDVNINNNIKLDVSSVVNEDIERLLKDD